MTAWEKWTARPQSLFVRKALFQAHLWTGIGLGLYVLLMSVSGSALVFRRELTNTLAREPRVAVGPGAPMSAEELAQAAGRVYPGYEITRVAVRRGAGQAALVWLERGNKKLQRLFNPYTGADMGDSLRFGFRFVVWLVDLHDNLLIAQTGRWINAAGGVFSVLLCLTGAVIWWPGSESWRRSLSFRWKVNPKGFNWTLHSALGFWSLLFVLMWAFTGIYLSIPSVFNATVDFLEPKRAPRGELRFGDQVLYWLSRLHFGRFGGVPVEIIWTILGLAPAVLFFTALVMWWKRVLRPWLGRTVLAESRIREASASRSESSAHAGS